MSETENLSLSDSLQGQKIALPGRFASMPKRELKRLVQQHGGQIVEADDPSLHTLVLGDEETLVDLPDVFVRTHESRGDASNVGPRLEIIHETELLRRLGLVPHDPEVRQLYTPALLAQIVGVPVAVIRRWHRRGLIVPARFVRKLPYFDYQEVTVARRLAQLLASGISPREIERKLNSLAAYVPAVERPLAQLSVIVEGKDVLLRHGEGLIDAGGQRRFDFDAEKPTTPAEESSQPDQVLSFPGQQPSQDFDQAALLNAAMDLEDDGQFAEAIQLYRAVLATSGPSAETCFRLGELLYRIGDLPAARERYYMVLETDEDYLEARANLGCVLAEEGEFDLAVAAFEGTLAMHPDYPDVHYHLARLLDELQKPDEALPHWQDFLRLVPSSPWAAEARERLGAPAPTHS